MFLLFLQQIIQPNFGFWLLLLAVIIEISVDHLSQCGSKVYCSVGKFSDAVMTLRKLDHLHPRFHGHPHLSVVCMAEDRTPREFVGGDYELKSFELLFEFKVLVLRDWSSDAFKHALHRRVVGGRKCNIDLKLFRSHQLYFLVLLLGFL